MFSQSFGGSQSPTAWLLLPPLFFCFFCSMVAEGVARARAEVKGTMQAGFSQLGEQSGGSHCGLVVLGHLQSSSGGEGHDSVVPWQ